MNGVAERLAAVQTRIADACRQAGRDPSEVELVAVSKRHGVDAIEAAYAAGHREFGESYVPELETKVQATQHLPDIRFRFIGHLQSNKAKRIAHLGVPVDAVDSLKLGRALSRHAGKTLSILVQVNVFGESSKSGVPLAEVEELVAELSSLPRLDVCGLMTLPPPDLSEAASAFAQLAALAQSLSLPTLSMGMSADLEVAIEAGSTQVRVGTAIFGPRN